VRTGIVQERTLGRFLEAVLDQQVQVVALIQDLADNSWIQRHETAGFAVLLGYQLLIERGYLDINVEVGEVEIGREAARRVAVPVPIDVEGGRLVVP
jgi:hypothetical protein